MPRATLPTRKHHCATAAFCLLAALTQPAPPAHAKERNEFALKDPKAAASCKPDARPPSPRTRSAADSVKVLPPLQGIYAGVYSIGTTRADVRAFERKTGKPPAIVFTFHDWVLDDDLMRKDPPLRTLDSEMEDKGITALQLAQQLAERGTVLALTWAIQCCEWTSTAWWFGLKKTEISVPRLLKGDFDDYIRRVARQTKGFGKPIMMSLFSEFNWQGAFAFGEDGMSGISRVDDICGQYGDPAWPDGPERIRDAHIHVIDIFRQEGVKNVTWFMYANSGYMDPAGTDYSPWLHPKFFYPGDDYMDWVGQSTYFVDPSWTQQISEDAAVIERALGPGYRAWGEVTQKPLLLPEFAAVGDKKVNRAPVLREVMGKVLPGMPRVKAITLADFLIAEICCQVPRLGEPHADEITAWRQSVGENPAYQFKVRTGPPSASSNQRN